jgi:hypothetical protein
MRKYYILAILTFFLTLATQGVASRLGYESYKETLGALQNISSIVFAITGAWIAVIYPRAMGRVFQRSPISDHSLRDADVDARYLSELVEIVMVSAFVLMIVLLIQYAAPILQEIVHSTALVSTKKLAFGIVSFLTFSQLFAIFRVVLTNYFFLNDLRNKNVYAIINKLHG